MEEAENVIAGYPTVKCEVQSNLGYPDIDYPDFFSGPVFFMNINELRC